ncbi:Aminodeoxychorismate lyase [Paraglaciecola mesophila]|uniref:Aminodeoxychorismate lyase n=1 Tax=Paraglaciecola mesophila TaxID=197222 RepID=A0A857JDZ4_9ALTE|nr:aminodeoxychorismate lyase [Paraglaciecola mesophila]QHJ10243.1 Aminodeoxychorismate lyase [Paraglaciecola mesophila]
MIVNGSPATQLDIADRATQYGDGCFTTMLVKDGTVEYWQAHLTRLKTSCERLFIQFTAWDDLTSNVFAMAQQGSSCVLKVLISRGSGGRGYSPEGANQPIYIISEHPYPSHYDDWQASGIELNVSRVALAKQPLLAGIKHLNRLEQVLIKHELANDAFQDCIVLDTDGVIVESSVGNIFWYHDNVWYTPSLHFSGVEGVMRNHVVDYFSANQITIHQCRETQEAIQSASEVFVCNSLMGIVPVSAIEFSDGHRAYYLHDRTRELQMGIDDY